MLPSNKKVVDADKTDRPRKRRRMAPTKTPRMTRSAYRSLQASEEDNAEPLNPGLPTVNRRKKKPVAASRCEAAANDSEVPAAQQYDKVRLNILPVEPPSQVQSDGPSRQDHCNQAMKVQVPECSDVSSPETTPELLLPKFHPENTTLPAPRPAPVGYSGFGEATRNMSLLWILARLVKYPPETSRMQPHPPQQPMQYRGRSMFSSQISPCSHPPASSPCPVGSPAPENDGQDSSCAELLTEFAKLSAESTKLDWRFFAPGWSFHPASESTRPSVSSLISPRSLTHLRVTGTRTPRRASPRPLRSTPFT